jgi:hypothetical protein
MARFAYSGNHDSACAAMQKFNRQHKGVSIDAF